MSVCSSVHLLTRTHCAQCSPSIPQSVVASQILVPAGGMTQSPDRALPSHIPVSRDRQRDCLSIFLYIKLFELGVQVAFDNRSVVTHHKVNLLKIPLRSSYSERTDDACVLLICFFFLHL